jgi:hypothetical protein
VHPFLKDLSWASRRQVLILIHSLWPPVKWHPVADDPKHMPPTMGCGSRATISASLLWPCVSLQPVALEPKHGAPTIGDATGAPRMRGV